MRHLSTLLFVLVGLALTEVLLSDGLAAEKGQNWPQWRGPLGNGVAPLADPPLEWDEQTNIKWKVAIPGRGSATPVVWDDRIYLLTSIGPGEQETEEAAPEQAPGARVAGSRRDRAGFGFSFGPAPAPSDPYQFVLMCLDRKTGETIWKKVAVEEVPHEAHHSTNTYASASPITDGQRVYASFGSRGIYCFDMEGNLQWERDLGDMQTRHSFGEGSSPTLYKDTLLVPWDHEGQSSLVALDAKTGKTRWQVERDEPTTWATPLVVEHKGGAQVITNGTNRVRSYDLESGKLLWECGQLTSNPIATPVTTDGLVICTTGHRGMALYAIPLDARGDISGTDEIAWYRSNAGSYIASPIVYDELLYITNSRDAILTCIDATSGETVYGPERLPELSTLYASPVAAEGRIYYVDRDGSALVLKHGPELEVLASNQLDEGFDASPVLVGGQLLLRGERHLYCIEDQGQE